MSSIPQLDLVDLKHSPGINSLVEETTISNHNSIPPKGNLTTLPPSCRLSKRDFNNTLPACSTSLDNFSQSVSPIELVFKQTRRLEANPNKFFSSILQTATGERFAADTFEISLEISLDPSPFSTSTSISVSTSSPSASIADHCVRQDKNYNGAPTSTLWILIFIFMWCSVVCYLWQILKSSSPRFQKKRKKRHMGKRQQEAWIAERAKTSRYHLP